MLTKLSISSDLDSGQLFEQVEVQLYYQALDQTPPFPIEKPGLVMIFRDQLHEPVERPVRGQIYDHLRLQVVGAEQEAGPLWFVPIQKKIQAHLSFVLNRKGT